MKRLTPAEVIEAYERSERIPERGSYQGIYGNTSCGVGAVSLAQKPSIADALDIFQTFVHELDYGLTYHDGLTIGFDGRRGEDIDPEKWEFKRYVEGYEDGQAAWDAVQPLVPEEEG